MRDFLYFKAGQKLLPETKMKMTAPYSSCLADERYCEPNRPLNALMKIKQVAWLLASPEDPIPGTEGIAALNHEVHSRIELPNVALCT